MKYRMLSVVLTVVLTLGLLSTLSASRQIQADQLSATSKLSTALQQALNDSSYASVWSDSSKQTVRTLIQTFDPVSTQLLTAVTAAGGSVVRQFTSINGILAELPKARVLDIAARGDVERITADHLSQQSASHLEAATGADLQRSYNSITRTFTGLDGSGVGIAILDSGIMANQYDIALLLAAGPLVAIVYATCHFYFKQSDERARAGERISRLHLATVEALATAIDAKDQITHEHVYRVQVYAAGLARRFGLSELEIEALKAGALLHDVGKIAVPDYILNKPGKLTAAEFERMKIHTAVGAQILERVNFPYPVVPIVRHHHERWDGRGYPDGLKGEQIPLTARILTVADCFDAVREDRQYRKAMTREQACQFLTENAGKQFDPSVVEAFLTDLPLYEQEIAAHKESEQPLLTPTTQAGLSESALRAVPAAGLAQTDTKPEYVKQISAAHVEVAALYEMAQTFSANLDVQDVVTLTVNRIERMVPFTTCAVYLRQADNSSVAAYAFGQNAERIRNRVLAAGHGIAGWVVINGRPMSNTDPMLDLQEFLGSNETGYSTAAVYPLTDGEGTIGALAIYASELDDYTNDHLHLFESVSRLASTALQHAMLHEQTKASAQTDALTGLPNGRALYARFDNELAEAKRDDVSLSVICFNIAGLRAVNESYCYQAGDRMLAEVARRLREAVGEVGMLGRIAGDEFIYLLKDLTQAQATRLGKQAQADIGSFCLEMRPKQYPQVGLRFGVAEFPSDGQSIDQLLQAALLMTRQNEAFIDGRQTPWHSQPAPAEYSSKRKTGPLALVG